ncbi:hypothetical protein BH10PSE13_BH10PSE13_02420 [soil metagenome]
MMRFGAGAMLAGACLLASCDKAPTPGNGVDAVATIMDSEGNGGNAASPVVNRIEPKGASAGDEDAIRTVIDSVYAAYSTPAGPTARPHVSPDFKAALDKAERADEAGLGYDPWCECQDFESTRFQYSVKSVQFAPDGDHARATLTLDLGFEDKASAVVRKWIGVIRTPKGWLIDDLSNANGKSLKTQIRATPIAPPPVTVTNEAE